VSSLTEKQLPVDGLQASSVHALLSLQMTGVPWQAPPPHTSPAVHRRPSLQETLLLAWTQPVTVLQESSVQTLLSLQSSEAPGEQDPPTQRSVTVQAFPSLQAIPSLGDPPPHVPLTHASPAVQTFPSSQGPVANACEQPIAGMQPSVVH
jgi:hypothetical protein